MVAVTATGEIFSLQAAGSAAADGWISVGGDLQISGDVLAELVLCHGISAAVGAEIVAAAEARLGALWVLTASGAGDASAQAHAFARGLFSGNVFEDFGAALSAGADAAVSASGEVAGGLDVAGLAALAEALLDETADHLALDLFYAFLNEVRIEGGVKGIAYAGAAATAEATVAGNLLADPARFEIAISASAAAGVGAGAKGFVRCELEDPKRWTVNSAELLATAIAAEARRHLPRSSHQLIEYVQLLVPVVFGLAWELGEIATLDALAPPEEFAERVIAIVAGRLQRWVLDRGVDLGLNAAAEVLHQLPLLAVLREVDDPARVALADALDAIAAGLPAQPISVTRLAEIADTVLAAVGATLGSGAERTLGQPLALAWTAAAAVIAIRDPAAVGSVGGSVIGAGPIEFVGDELLSIPELPAFVRREWGRLLGRRVGRTGTFADCVNVLIAAGIGPRLAATDLLKPLLGDIAGRLDFSPGDVVQAALVAGLGGQLHTTDLYQRLRDLIADGIDDVLVGQLLPQLRAALPRGNASRRWLNEAVTPSLLATRHFVLERVDALVAGTVSGDLSPFFNRLRTLLGVLAGKIVLRNVEVLTALLVEHTITQLPVRLRAGAAAVRAGTSTMAGTWPDVVATLLPPGTPGARVAGPARQLLAGLLDTGAEMMEVYTPRRLRSMSELRQRCLRVDDLAVDYASAGSIEAFVDNVADCSFIPDPEAVLELAGLLLTIQAEQLGIAVQRAVPLLGEFVTDVAAPWVDDLQDGFGDFLTGVEDSLADLAHQIEEADDQIQDAALDAADFLRDVQDHLRAAESALRSEQTRARVREDVRKAGREAAVALLGDGGGVLFDGGWSLFGGVLDPALDVLADITDWFADVVGDAADVVRAMAAIEAELARRVRDALLGIDFGELARFLGIGDVVDAALGAARQPAVRAELDGVMTARASRAAAQDRGRAAARDKAIGQAKQKLLERRRDAVNTRNVQPTIITPAALGAGQSGLPVPTAPPVVRVALARGDQRLLTGSPPRLGLVLNGRTVAIGPNHLVATPGGGVELRRVLVRADGLRPGVNVAECAVAQPPPTAVTRRSVVFGWQPARPVRSAGQDGTDG